MNFTNSKEFNLCGELVMITCINYENNSKSTYLNITAKMK